MDRRGRWIALFVTLTLLAVWPAHATAVSTARLALLPSLAQARPGETARMEIWITGVTGLARIEFNVTYDANALDLVDADPGRDGVQIEAGSMWCSGCNPVNSAADGTIRFVAFRAPIEGPFNGNGVVAAITFRVRSGTTPASYPVRFDPTSVRMLDSDDQPLPGPELGDGILRVPPVARSITGRVDREGTNDHQRTAVTAFFYPPGSWSPPEWARTCTDAAGSFVLTIPTDQVTSSPPIPMPAVSPPSDVYEWAYVRFSFSNYLSECYWQRLDQENVNMGWHTLEGGDVNGDGCVNIFDVVRVIRDFGQSVPAPCLVPYEPCAVPGPIGSIAPASDINGDCQVNIYDLSIVGKSFGLCTSCH